MRDEKKIPSIPPPDDFSKTTPNINLPEHASEQGNSDWDKTNYNFPRQPPPADDWGKTVANIKPIDTSHQDFDKTFFPGANKPSTPEWGMTEAKIDLSNTDFGSGEAPQEEGYGKTTPYFRLPEAERAKYQNLPPTPAEQAAKDEQDRKAKGGIPAWVWISLGLLAMFFFMIVVIVGVWFFVRPSGGYEVTVKGAPPGSEVRVDDAPVAVSSDDGSSRLLNLKGGERRITIVHPTYTCEARNVTLRDNTNPEPIIARCQAVAAKPTEDCTNIGIGEEDKAERCYYAALNGLPDPFTPEDLVKALNILVINFASGSFEVPPVRFAALQKAAEYIKKLPPGVVLEVGGHTDNVGNDTSNQTLSQNRANAVKTKLVGFGVTPDALQIRGYGATKPKTDNNTEQGKFHNRRIEYSVVKK